MSTLSFPNDEPKLRLCCIRKTADFTGYGFDLRNLKHRRGHFIGNIDVGSPAEVAGLRLNDRIIEVNGINVANENHYQVVERIKAVPAETRLLVVDQATDDYYRDKVILNGEMSNIVYLENKPENDSPDNGTVEAEKSKENDIRLPPNLPAPRLCYLVKWPGVEGYGFTLHVEKGKTGQYIGEVTPNTPASAGGLQAGDRILTVNGNSVIGDSHKEVVRKMKEFISTLRLLVCQPKMEEYLRTNDIILHDDVPGIVIIQCPPTSDRGNSLLPKEITSDLHKDQAQTLERQRRLSTDSGNVHSVDVSQSSSTQRSQGDASPANASPLLASRVSHHHGNQSSSANDTNNTSRTSSPLATPPMQRLTLASQSTQSQSTAITTNAPSTYSPATERVERGVNSRHASVSSEVRESVVTGTSLTTIGQSQQVQGYRMSAAEARERLRVQRQRDRARISGMTVNEKYNIYQKL